MRFQDTHIIVRFNEVDAYHVAWHGHFVAWMEVGRNDLAARFSLAPDQLSASGYMGPVVSLELKYLSPVRFNDVVIVRTTVQRMETPTLKFCSIIIGSDGKPAARGSTIHALTDMNGVIQYSLPDVLADRFAKLFEWAGGTD